ncbi:MAG: hypothetical protein COB66_00080 [Coxiella sp. (in: Bacteria)]|nr:MAG: hypothetical protein COB66_00080 [Coxiella sp. (in: g-proteobacteria)]
MENQSKKSRERALEYLGTIINGRTVLGECDFDGVSEKLREYEEQIEQLDPKKCRTGILHPCAEGSSSPSFRDYEYDAQNQDMSFTGLEEGLISAMESVDLICSAYTEEDFTLFQVLSLDPNFLDAFDPKDSESEELSKKFNVYSSRSVGGAVRPMVAVSSRDSDRQVSLISSYSHVISPAAALHGCAVKKAAECGSSSSFLHKSSDWLKNTLKYTSSPDAPNSRQMRVSIDDAKRIAEARKLQLKLTSIVIMTCISTMTGMFFEKSTLMREVYQRILKDNGHDEILRLFGFLREMANIPRENTQQLRGLSKDAISSKKNVDDMGATSTVVYGKTYTSANLQRLEDGPDALAGFFNRRSLSSSPYERNKSVALTT